MISIDVYTIKKYIINNPEYIKLLLEKAGFHHITKRNNEYRCAREINTNPTSVRIKIDTLGSRCFSTGISGDIITLLQEKLQLDFKNVLKFICNTIGISNEGIYRKPIELPFGGYYKKIGKNKNKQYNIKTIDKDILTKYKIIPNQMFYKDGISFRTQHKYQIGYDSASMRITIPWWDFEGNLVGIMGRYNELNIDDNINKYFPIVSFPKHQTLYGYYQNYQHIQEKQIVIIGEAEKFVQQLDTMEIYNGLALGGNALSPIQIRNIQALNPKLIIMAFDEGLDEELIRVRAKKLKMNNIFMKNQVYYIYDKNNTYLPKGSKMSPTDRGKKIFYKLLKECLVKA